MTESKKTKAELIAENEALRSRVAELERNKNQKPIMQPGSAEEVERGEGIERLKGILATIPQGVLQINTAGTVTYGNPAYHKLFGYGDGELIGTSLLDSTESEEERKSLSEFLSMMANDQPPPISHFKTRRTKDGRTVDLQVDWNYQRDRKGKLVGFTSVLTDITEDKQAEEEMQASQRLLQTVFDSLPHSVFVRDKEGRYLMVNGVLTNRYGLTPKEFSICRRLMQEPGSPVHKRELIQCVWGQGQEANTNFIEVHLANLRKKLAGAGRKGWIQTVRSTGFMLLRPE